MSLTAIVWVATGAVLCIQSLRRPIWAVSLYMLTFFAAPHLWWWGDDIPAARYALWAGFGLIFSVLAYQAQEQDGQGGDVGTVHKLAIAMAVNATFVHFLLATRPEISVEDYVEFLKYILLFFLLCWSIRDRRDLRIAFMTIALGSAYIGYEVTINERGDFTGARLEGVGAPAADTANGLACLMLAILPIIGSLFLNGTKIEKATVLVSAPLTLNVLLLCNSRGAFLGLIGGGLAFLVLARGESRKKALKVLVLGALALYLLLGDPKILDRFATTFAGSEERDNSAASRMVFWSAGLRMLQDYPLGDGGSAFKYVHAETYLRMVGSDEPARSLHNGYLTTATDWGVQGLTLMMFFIGLGVVAAYRTSEVCRKDGRAEDALLGVSLICAVVGFLIATFFGSFLNNEWAFWLVAFLMRYAFVYRSVPVTVTSAPVPRSEFSVRQPPAAQPAMSRGGLKL